MNQTEFKKLFAKNLRRVMAERELVRLAMTAELENVKTALILLSALEQKNAPHG